ncbi:MAG: heavy metal-binding domain-containing protein [Candidatus Thiothrix sulfatifontis]|nr:MAG: heavy metal-binding domain-containing protein [Candidatus Thiothrix sulfatifontis]
MIQSTTHSIEGKRITQYHGVVTGEAILSGGMLMVTVSGTAVNVQ